MQKNARYVAFYAPNLEKLRGAYPRSLQNSAACWLRDVGKTAICAGFFQQTLNSLYGLVKYGFLRKIKSDTFEVTDLGIQVRRLFQSDAVDKDDEGFHIIGKVVKNGRRVGSVICRGYYIPGKNNRFWDQFDNHDTELIEIEI